MQIDTMDRNVLNFVNRAPAPRYEDPLDHDEIDDMPIVTTMRSILRVALVASETASRFMREQTDADPMAWMLAPRRLFGGRAAIEGCLERDGCLRAVLLHGLSMGLDADPEAIDELANDDEDDDDCDLNGSGTGTPEPGHPRLWTSFLVRRCDMDTVQAFDALVANDRFEAEARLRARHGPVLGDELEILEGFDASLPLAEALVSPALADMLAQVAAAPASPLAAGLSVSVQQRFTA